VSPSPSLPGMARRCHATGRVPVSAGGLETRKEGHPCGWPSHRPLVRASDSLVHGGVVEVVGEVAARTMDYRVVVPSAQDLSEDRHVDVAV